jgi:hypothetical protein
MRDFLGAKIEVGMRGIRVYSYSHNKEFKKITVEKIDESKKYGDCIGIVTDGDTKIGWTYPERIIVETNFKEKL